MFDEEIYTTYIYDLCLYVCAACEYLYAYIGFIQWEVKQTEALGD